MFHDLDFIRQKGKAIKKSKTIGQVANTHQTNINPFLAPQKSITSLHLMSIPHPTNPPKSMATSYF